MTDEQFEILCRKIDNIANVLLILFVTIDCLILFFGTMLLVK